MNPLTPFSSTSPVLLELPSEAGGSAPSSLAFRCPPVGDQPARWYRPLEATGESAADLERRFTDLNLQLPEPEADKASDPAAPSDLSRVIDLLNARADLQAIQDQSVLASLSALGNQIKELMQAKDTSARTFPGGLGRGLFGKGGRPVSMGGPGAVGGAATFGGLAQGGPGRFSSLADLLKSVSGAPTPPAEEEECSCLGCFLKSLFEEGKEESPGATPPAPESKDDCDCPNCLLRRQLEALLPSTAAETAKAAAAKAAPPPMGLGALLGLLIALSPRR